MWNAIGVPSNNLFIMMPSDPNFEGFWPVIKPKTNKKAKTNPSGGLHTVKLGVEIYKSPCIHSAGRGFYIASTATSYDTFSSW